VILLLTRLPEVFETWMQADVFNRNRMDLFGDQSGEAFMKCKAQRNDAFLAESEARGENEVRAVGLSRETVIPLAPGAC
jgi:hypothetical protein